MIGDELTDNEVADRLLSVCYLDEIKDLRKLNAELLKMKKYCPHCGNEIEVAISAPQPEGKASTVADKKSEEEDDEFATQYRPPDISKVWRERRKTKPNT